MTTASSGPRSLTVSQFNRRVQAILESGVPLSWIEGEVSNLVAPASGHLYFTLKDSESQLRAAMFRNRRQLLAFVPRNGMQVRVRARPSLYMPRGEYQLIVEHIEDAGIGGLQRAFEALKAKLAAEGLFDAERKRAVPEMPTTVGVVTSAAGAAIHDIVTVLKRRAPWIEVVIYPTLVQGADAAPAIVEAITCANRRAEVDVLIVGRGGGSIEDLWPFNEEIVARAVAGSGIPVISAVGHETDVTIADFVADLRAPTPSAAAETVAPPRAELLDRTRQHLRLLTRAMSNQLRESQSRLLLARKSLIRPDQRLREVGQTLDEFDLRLRRAIQQRIHQEKTGVTHLGTRLLTASPGQTISAASGNLQGMSSRLARALRAKLEHRRLALGGTTARLHTVSPLATLGRGYAIVQNANGNVLRNASDAKHGDIVTARLGHGAIDCRVEAIHPDKSTGADAPG